MAKGTRATTILEKAGIPFTLHPHTYDPAVESKGLQAAKELGETPDHVLKTLLAHVDSKPVCVILASDQQASMKKLAAAVGGKSATMMAPEQAEKMTGYKVGGISPFGQMRKVPIVLDEAALAHDLVYINAGQRGLQLRLSPSDAVRVLNALVAPVSQ